MVTFVVMLVVLAARACASVNDAFITITNSAVGFRLKNRSKRNIRQLAPIDALNYDDDDATLSTLSSGKTLHSLIAKVESYYPNADRQLIVKAYNFSLSAHEGQKRKSGEPYFIHPVEVAHIIADMRLDVASVVTGLLHDTVEDTNITLDVIRDEFGTEIGKLVDGVTKIGLIKFQNPRERQAENYRKMIVAMAEDIRVLLVKLADRTHNIRTLHHIPSQQKQRDTATETIELYAPLAHRLGLFKMKTELEDRSFQYVQPEVYRQIKAMVSARQEQKQEYSDGVIATLKDQMEAAGLNGELTKVTGRLKSVYSIYQKMKTRDSAFDDIHDLVAFRILVEDIGQCYLALGVVHSNWKPVPGRFKDYIALPKPNGYKSLHTTLLGPEGGRIEVQIRTHDMHVTCEYGLASHWQYKGGSKGIDEAQRFSWLRQLVDWVQQLNDPQEFILSVKEELLFEKEIFVFSPKGQLFALAKGASVLDFAYLVHSDIGSHCIGGKVNGKMQPLRYILSNGDFVEILQSSGQTPQNKWLAYVITSKAKTKIRSWLKAQQREESAELGKVMLLEELKKHPNGAKEYREKFDSTLTALGLRDERHLFTSLGYGQISIARVANEIFFLAGEKQSGVSKDGNGNDLVRQAGKEKSNGATSTPSSNDGIVVGGQRNMLTSFCRNCSPLHGEEIKGVITQGRGIKVHRVDCKYLLESDEERRIDATWDEDTDSKARDVDLNVVCEDKPGILAGMSKAISTVGINIRSVVLKKLPDGRGIARFKVMLSSVDELHKVMNQLQKEDGVLSVARK